MSAPARAPDAAPRPAPGSTGAAPGGLRAAAASPVAVVGAGALLLAAVALGVLVGPAGIGPGEVALSLLDRLPLVDLDSGLSTQQEAILYQLRLPRVVLGALVGAMLAVAGAAYQGVFRNPLADPYLLGVAAGGGLGATLAIVSDVPAGVLPVAAFAGALCGVAGTWLLGRTAGRGSGRETIILAGVAVAAFLTAGQTFLQQRNSDDLREVYAWILGRLVTAGWREVLLVLPYVVVATVVIAAHRRMLDVLSLGRTEAGSLGVHTGRVQLVVVVAATLGTAAAVAVSGLIGFVGIVVPHTVRLLFGASYRVILPLSFLLGAAFLVVADVVARAALSPAELPIGVVTAFVGAPFFTVVLRTTARRAS